jgi:hypothetical protein
MPSNNEQRDSYLEIKYSFGSLLLSQSIRKEDRFKAESKYTLSFESR